MRRLLYTIIMVTGAVFAMYGQSKALQDQMTADKNELTFSGYTFVDGGEGKTSNDWVLQFDHHEFKEGNYYMVLVYYEGCSTCEPGMYFHDKSTDEVQELEPTVEKADGFVRGTYHVHQTADVQGKLAVYVKSKKEVHTYALLYYMWDFSPPDW
jgi:hypothetical protein